MNRKIPNRLTAVSSDRKQYLYQPVLWPQLHFVVALEGRLDEARMARALRLAMDAEPVFGCRYVSSRRPYWQRRGDLDTLPLCDVIESTDVKGVLTEFRARPCDAAVNPLIQACIVRGENDTLCIKISHCAADGGGGKDLVELIASIYRNLAVNPAYSVTPNLGSRSRMQLFRQLGLFHCLKLCWKSFRDRAPRPPRNEWRFPSSNREDWSEVRYTMRRLPPERFDAIRAYAKPRGATLNDVFMAAYFRSLCQFLDPHVELPQTVLMPVSLRPFLRARKTEAICNFAALFRVSMPRIPGESFEATLERVKESSKDSVGRTQHAMFGALMSAALYRLVSAQLKRFVERAQRKNVVDGRTIALFSNNGALEAEHMDFGLPVADAYEIVLPPAPPGVFVVVVSFRKILTFTVSYCSKAILPEVMESFLDHFVRELPAAGSAAESPGEARASGSVRTAP